ncbi:MAG: heat-inducible transcription repressor HrcA [Candidatus Krumholzibacteria bacterium]|nr:heat-inducible transcription repressor HrcA [Candidatus Krumholzibacteria bacterium]
MKDKDWKILRMIIDLYVAEGVPVSSRAVRDAGHPLSTASIRNYMAALERDGYLAKPHTSAGRMPTDKAYRFYVDELQANQSRWNEMTRRCRAELRDESREINEIMLHASRLLGDISKNFAVVYGSVMQESRVGHVQLVNLDGPRILVVVNLEPEYERTTVLRLDKSYSDDVVASAERIIDRAVAGKTVDVAKIAVDSVIRDNVTGEGIITREVSINRESVFSEPPAVELYFEERSHLLEQPELSDPKNLQLILKLLHNKDYLTEILSNRLPDGTQVTIGAENVDEELRPFSLITAGYRMGAAHGVLGIIGPTRMRYDVALLLVSSVSRELGAIGEEYF